VVGSWIASPLANYRQLRRLSHFEDDTAGAEGQPSDILYALRDFSMEVRKGEVLGIIGRNGAGKSTLLKILSRIVEPTTGRVEIYGRVASLLEVGTGFHPELTGRENIYLNGTILGMRKQEIDSKFDEIVDFSGIEKFLDTQVKRYSSGMYVRLAFAVAAHLEPEILILDEVLAVGDGEFQKKCLSKMNDVAHAGRTILFVSHNLVAVQSLCTRAILLSEGRVLDEGPTASVISGYLRMAHGRDETAEWDTPETAPGTDALRVKHVQILPESPEADGLLTMQTPLRVQTDFWVLNPDLQLHLTYHLLNDQGIVVLTTGSPSGQRERGIYRAWFTLPANLLNSGGYTLRLLIVQNESRVIYQNDSLASFTVADTAVRDRAYMGREPGVVQPALQWRTETIGS
jgi:lipopolysaccharide transport system ATP-binding protein